MRQPTPEPPSPPEPLEHPRPGAVHENEQASVPAGPPGPGGASNPAGAPTTGGSPATAGKPGAVGALAPATRSVRGRAGVIELNRPKALNSLNAEMLDVIAEGLEEWDTDPAVEHVVLRSAIPKAFCAGGDVRWVREQDLRGDVEAGDRFFDAEFALNHRMATYPKPIVALMEGVVMGGGFGISAHGSHRVVTPRSIGAMPETAIGFLPDVGMSHRLSHLPGVPLAVGLLVGLTGWRLSAADMLYTGLATHVVEDVSAVADALESASVADALAAQPQPQLRESELRRHAGVIAEIFEDGSWLEIQSRLLSYEPSSEAEAEFVSTVRALAAKGNPTSMVVTVEIFRRNAELSLREALDNEARAGRYLRRQPNFAEGVRAVLVDKDQRPRFSPSDAGDVDVAEIRRLLDGR